MGTIAARAALLRPRTPGLPPGRYPSGSVQHPRVARRFVTTCLLGGVTLALLVGLLVPAAQGLGNATQVSGVSNPLQLRRLNLPSKVFDRSGNLLAVLSDAGNREPVPLSRVPHNVIQAVLDTEDNTFYLHGGVDLRSILRAAKADATSGQAVQGGSTITQQLVKNSLLTSQHSLSRKVNEAVLAYRLAHQLSKDQILDRYLNTVYFGNGAYGIEAAAKAYFGLDVNQLATVQAALLAGLIKGPSPYDPIAHPQAALRRRNQVLDLMVANQDLVPGEAASLKSVPLPTTVNNPSPQQDTPFVEEVKLRLLGDPRLGPTPEDRYNTLYEGGLRVTTGLDPTMQAQAEAAVRRQMPNSGGRFTASLVAVDPTTGMVRALVSGNKASQTGYDVATGRGGGGGRSPGSAFKPFVLMAALAAGHSLYDTVDGTAPCTFQLPHSQPSPPLHNAEPGGGVLTLLNATASSVNCAYLRLGVDQGLGLGNPRVPDMAHLLGIPAGATVPNVISAAIGGGVEVTPLQMATAYSTLAGDGVRHAPENADGPAQFVQSVVDPAGHVLVGGGIAGQRVVPAQEVRVANLALQAVVTGGTGTAAGIPGRPVAGKTGTTDNFTNAWFVGFTPQLCTAVWMGSPQGDLPMTNVGGVPEVFGGTFPASVWQAFMAPALANQPVASFPAPDYGLIPAGQYIQAPYTNAPPPPTSPSTIGPGTTGSGPNTTIIIPGQRPTYRYITPYPSATSPQYSTSVPPQYTTSPSPTDTTPSQPPDTTPSQPPVTSPSASIHHLRRRYG